MLFFFPFLGWSALMSAAENNNHEIACTLVDNGAEINAQMTSGWTAMHAASKVENKKKPYSSFCKRVETRISREIIGTLALSSKFKMSPCIPQS